MHLTNQTTGLLALLCLACTLILPVAVPAQQEVNESTQVLTQDSYLSLRDDPDANFYDIKAAFDAYWEGREITKGCGYKPFMRWIHHTEPLVFPTGEFPTNDMMDNSGRVYTPAPSAASMSSAVLAAFTTPFFFRATLMRVLSREWSLN